MPNLLEANASISFYIISLFAFNFFKEMQENFNAKTYSNTQNSESSLFVTSKVLYIRTIKKTKLWFLNQVLKFVEPSFKAVT